MTDQEPSEPVVRAQARGIPPGETPPAEDGTSGVAQPERPELTHAWGPWPLVTIVALTCLVAALFVVMGVVLLLD